MPINFTTIQNGQIHEWHKLSKLIMMFNFICQLEWAIKCLEIWSHIIVDISVRMLLDEIYI